MNFDDFDQFDCNEYEEVLPQDKEFSNWMGSIERDYAKVTAKLDVDDTTIIHTDGDVADEDDDGEEF